MGHKARQSINQSIDQMTDRSIVYGHKQIHKIHNGPVQKHEDRKIDVTVKY